METINKFSSREQAEWKTEIISRSMYWSFFPYFDPEQFYRATFVIISGFSGDCVA